MASKLLDTTIETGLVVARLAAAGESEPFIGAGRTEKEAIESVNGQYVRWMLARHEERREAAFNPEYQHDREAIEFYERDRE